MRRRRRPRAERRRRAARPAGASPATPTLVSGARTALLSAWRSNARKRLPELLASLDERLDSYGDAAYLLEPDLKEARGGFRDMIMLRALAATWLTDRPHAGSAEPYERLLDVRDALHVTSGRALDRLLARRGRRRRRADGLRRHRTTCIARSAWRPDGSDTPST